MGGGARWGIRISNKVFPRCNFRIAETGRADGPEGAAFCGSKVMIKPGRPSYENGPDDRQVHKRAKVEEQLLLLHCNDVLG